MKKHAKHLLCRQSGLQSGMTIWIERKRPRLGRRAHGPRCALAKKRQPTRLSFYPRPSVSSAVKCFGAEVFLKASNALYRFATRTAGTGGGGPLLASRLPIACPSANTPSK